MSFLEKMTKAVIGSVLKVPLALVVIFTLMSNPAVANRGDNITTKENTEVDVRELTRQADSGNNTARFKLAELYETGNKSLGISLNPALSIKLLNAAALDGYAPAQYRLGRNCTFPADSTTGIIAKCGENYKWLRSAAKSGYLPAIDELAHQIFVSIDKINNEAWMGSLLYFSGVDMRHANKREACKHAAIAAAQEMPRSQAIMAWCELTLNKNYQKGEEWLIKSAQKTDISSIAASYVLAGFYFFGDVLTQDYEKAYYWIVKSERKFTLTDRWQPHTIRSQAESMIKNTKETISLRLSESERKKITDKANLFHGEKDTSAVSSDAVSEIQRTSKTEEETEKFYRDVLYPEMNKAFENKFKHDLCLKYKQENKTSKIDVEKLSYADKIFNHQYNALLKRAQCMGLYSDNVVDVKQDVEEELLSSDMGSILETAFYAPVNATISRKKTVEKNCLNLANSAYNARDTLEKEPAINDKTCK